MKQAVWKTSRLQLKLNSNPTVQTEENYKYCRKNYFYCKRKERMNDDD